MKKDRNAMAIAGFVLTLCALSLFAAAFLCLIGVMLTPFLSVIFGEAAGLIAIFGIVLCGIGHHRSYRETMNGGGMALTGIVLGTIVVTMVLMIAALMILNWALALNLPISF